MTRFALALAVATLIPTLGHARDVAGVDFPDTIAFEGKTLKCNGAGLRKKFVVKVYAGALYLENNSTSAAEILKTDQVRVVQMQFLRDVDKGKIIGAYKDGFENNSKGDMAKLQPALDKMNGALGDMKSGKQMTVRYVPGKGVIITQQGGGNVTIDADAKVVADALLRNWIGSDPADGNLKTAMLAGK